LPKKILITGSNGLLGQKLAFLFYQSEQYELLLTSKQIQSVYGKSLPYKKVDITSKQELAIIVKEFAPDVVINAAAMTDVDKCELEKEKAWLANVSSIEHIVEVTNPSTHIIHFSTDYIFDGREGPYSEAAIPNPISYYGKTKLASENILYGSTRKFTILRTIVLYGTGINVKHNFALWLIQSLQQKKQIRVVTDQLGNPTLVDDLAYACLKVVELQREGLYHIAGKEIVNRYHFAIKLAELFHFDSNLITPIETSELKQNAPRPLRSGLITLKSETQLNLNLSGVEKGLKTLYHQLEFENKNIT